MNKSSILVIFLVIITTSLKAQYTSITNANVPSCLAISDSILYYTETGSRSISKLNIYDTLGSPETVVSNLNDVGGIAISDSTLYVAIPSQRRIIKFNLFDTNPIVTTIISFDTSEPQPRNIIIQDSTMYFSLGTVNGSATGKVCKLNLNETIPTYTTLKSGILGPYELALHGKYLYYTDGKSVTRLNISISSPTSQGVISNLSSALGLFVNEDNLYVMNRTSKQLTTYNSKTFNVENQLTIDSLKNPFQILLSENTFYFAEYSGNRISKYELPAVSIDERLSRENLSIFPNPSQSSISISGLTTMEEYKIYNSIGKVVGSGLVSPNSKIDLKNLDKGLYTVTLSHSGSIQFIKE